MCTIQNVMGNYACKQTHFTKMKKTDVLLCFFAMIIVKSPHCFCVVHLSLVCAL